jgi:hypothetical protein
MKSEIYQIGDDDGHTVAYEYEPSRQNAKAMYIRYDGRRIAYRGDPSGPHARTWVSMLPGCEVIDVDDGALGIYFYGKVLQ